MNLYLDGNSLVRLYLQSPDCGKISRTIGQDQVPVTDLLWFEVTNSMERMVFESRGGSPWRVSSEIAMLAQADFAQQLKKSRFLKRVPLTLSDIESEFDTLVRRYTAVHGFRTYDVIHVASALVLGSKRFLSFDAKANALAKLVGLTTAL
jgi:predicted nucleic acid-binding protein